MNEIKDTLDKADLKVIGITPEICIHSESSARSTSQALTLVLEILRVQT